MRRGLKRAWYVSPFRLAHHPESELVNYISGHTAALRNSLQLISMKIHVLIPQLGKRGPELGCAKEGKWPREEGEEDPDFPWALVEGRGEGEWVWV